jgi:predicted protein tyrosine phosphatase
MSNQPDIKAQDNKACILTSMLKWFEQPAEGRWEALEANFSNYDASMRNRLLNISRGITGMLNDAARRNPSDIEGDVSKITIPKDRGHLYLGDIHTALSNKTLTALGVTHVISLLNSPCVIPKDGVSHKMIIVDDTIDSKISGHFPAIHDYITEALSIKGVILVHCAMGVSRSSTAVISFLIKFCGMTRDQALDHVKKSREIICPNAGFLEQLNEWDAQRVLNQCPNVAQK